MDEPFLPSLDSLFNPTDNEQQPQQPLTFTAQAPLIQAPLPQQARLTSTFDQNIGAGQETEDVRALQQFPSTPKASLSALQEQDPQDKKLPTLEQKQHKHSPPTKKHTTSLQQDSLDHSPEHT